MHNYWIAQNASDILVTDNQAVVAAFNINHIVEVEYQRRNLQ